MVQFDGKSFTNLTPKEQNTGSNTGLFADKKGTIYVCTKYLGKYEGGTYSKIDWKDDIGKTVSTGLVDNQDKIWIGADGISRNDGATWTNYNKKNAGLASNAVYTLFQDSKNNIWAAMYDGVGKFDGTAWTHYTKKIVGFPMANMRGIVETKDGRILFSDGLKIVEFDGTAMKELAMIKPYSEIRNMILDEDGTLLIATKENGIVKFKDGAVSFCNETTCGLPSNATSYIVRDPAGKIWISYGIRPPFDMAAAQASMGMPDRNAPAKPAENPKDILLKKLKAFESPYGLVMLDKMK